MNNIHSKMKPENEGLMIIFKSFYLIGIHFRPPYDEMLIFRVQFFVIATKELP